MDHAIITAAPAATLSQSELFRRYLEAPVRVDATSSTLIADPGRMFDTSARERFFLPAFHEFLPNNFADSLLEEIASSDTPLFDMEMTVDALEVLLDTLKDMQADFARLAEVTRTEQPDDNAPEEIYNEWQDNPRYVLPVIAQKEAA